LADGVSRDIQFLVISKNDREYGAAHLLFVGVGVGVVVVVVVVVGVVAVVHAQSVERAGTVDLHREYEFPA
jgi:hypothetical protein